LDEAIVAPIALKSSTSDGISLLTNLISDINSKQVAKRALFSHMPFEIGPGFKISVKGYNILQAQKPARSCYIWLGGEKAQIAEGATRQHDDKEGHDVVKGEIKKAYKFGGETVSFTPEEQKELKNFGPPGLRLIGFKPQSMLPFWASVKKSTFIYPSEEDYIGSTRVFSALWQKLLKDKKMGLGWFIPRANAGPALVAILPSAERLDEVTNGQVFPAGLWLYPLPYADDIRHPPELPTPVVAPDNLKDRMHAVIQQLQLPNAIYDPSKYPNPSLQWHYKILQAMALEEELPEQPEDKTVPKYRQIQKRSGEYINQWGITLHEEFSAWDEKRRSRMKRETGDEDDPPKKKGRATPSAQGLEGMNTSDLKKLVVNNGLGKYTVSHLKELCLSKGLSTGGKKADLVERMEQWVEDNS
jgi:ATP-dependent DNA helicase 2 subunit 1